MVWMVTALVLWVASSLAPAAVVTTGDVNPATDPTTWTTGTTGYIGETADGTMTISGTETITNFGGYIGYDAGVTGSVTVDGAAALWDNGNFLSVGRDGTGMLTIKNGATVSAVGSVSLGERAGATGTIAFDTGTLTTRNLYASSSDLSGTGTINIGGGVIDTALVIDTAAGLTQTHTLSGPGQAIDVHYTADSDADLGTGWRDTGTLTISGGAIVTSWKGYLGYHAGSTGTATVTGTGTQWTLNENLEVGREGAGILNITDGGVVMATKETWLGKEPGATGAISLTNGTLTTKSLFATPSSLTGVGTINTNGLVSDVSMTIDAANPASRTISLSNPGQAIQIILDADGTGSMGVGYRGVSALTLSGGATLNSDDGYLGVRAGSHGTAVLSGAGTAWTCNVSSGFLFVGHSGMGTMTISSGATASAWRAGVGGGAGTSSSLTVTDAGSTLVATDLMFIGHEANGPGSTATMTIVNGGAVTCTDSLLSYLAGGVATVNISGAGSSWTSTESMIVGFGGNGTLAITAGGVASCEEATLGYQADATGTVTVSGAGSQWLVSNTTILGYEGSGVLTVSDGGFVQGSGMTIGPIEGATGTVTVDGAGSTLWMGTIYVGFDGVGTVTISNGGEVGVATLEIDINGNGNSEIDMCLGGRLVLEGDASDLAEFLALVGGPGEICYWDGAAWSNITGASASDYSVVAITTGDFAGFSVLTVTAVPEPATMSFLMVGALAMFKRRKA